MNRLYRFKDIDRNLSIARFRPLDVLIVGGTGAGKSSTINAMFNKEVAKVGRSCDPETADISSMALNDLIRFWDSPGLGDNIDNDENYAKMIKEQLYKTCNIGERKYGLIDMVLVILDGSGRDMGTTYNLLNDVVIPNFQPRRVLVAINQADIAMKGRHWNEEKNRPDPVLMEYLYDKARSVRERIEEATGVKIAKPVFYSAEQGYNIDKLLDMIIDNMPKGRRSVARRH